MLLFLWSLIEIGLGLHSTKLQKLDLSLCINAVTKRFLKGSVISGFCSQLPMLLSTGGLTIVLTWKRGLCREVGLCPALARCFQGEAFMRIWSLAPTSLSVHEKCRVHAVTQQLPRLAVEPLYTSPAPSQLLWANPSCDPSHCEPQDALPTHSIPWTPPWLDVGLF